MVSIAITIFFIYKWLSVPTEKAGKYIFFALISAWYTLGWGV